MTITSEPPKRYIKNSVGELITNPEYVQWMSGGNKHNVPAPAAVAAPPPQTYEELDWDDLPPEAMNAAMALGYTKDHWDNGMIPRVSKKPWADLSFNQQQAATQLGYSPATWEADAEQSLRQQAPVGNQCTKGHGHYENTSWKKLPPNARHAAKALGYNRFKWEWGFYPVACWNYWDQLSPTQQQAATTLGYTQAYWDSH